MKNPYVKICNDLHKDFAKKNPLNYDNWSEEYEGIIREIDTEIIDLGCGVTGNNTLYLLEMSR